jgi:hypothetical protein
MTILKKKPEEAAEAPLPPLTAEFDISVPQGFIAEAEKQAARLAKEHRWCRLERVYDVIREHGGCAVPRRMSALGDALEIIGAMPAGSLVLTALAERIPAWQESVSKTLAYVVRTDLLSLREANQAAEVLGIRPLVKTTEWAFCAGVTLTFASPHLVSNEAAEAIVKAVGITPPDGVTMQLALSPYITRRPEAVITYQPVPAEAAGEAKPATA